jgi:pimeloyl-ACP methyl ester carboxylesterase
VPDGRPPQPPTPAPDAFAVHRAVVRHWLSIAFIDEGEGYPLLLLHGYPETKRIWWRNIAPLAAAGYEVVVPDLRGHGDSDIDPGDRYDLVEYSRDVHTLMTDHLGHERYGVIAGDVGAAVAYDLSLRFSGSVQRMVWFNTAPPVLPVEYRAAGIDVSGQPYADPDRRPETDYQFRQGNESDALAAELDTPERRRAYIADFYGHRLWASRGTFTGEDIDFMTEPWGEEDRLRAGWAVYQLMTGNREVAEFPHLLETNPTPTLILYGPDDQVVDENFVACCEVAFTERVGPLVVPRSGHFLQWERADILNPLAANWFAGLR